MSANTSIEWTDATWNPTRGCTKRGRECENCYAMSIAHRFSGPGQPYEGLTRVIGGRGQWTGHARMIWEKLEEPLSWRTPRMIFVDSMSDLFHEDIEDDEIMAIFGTMVAAVHLRGHTFQVLTKCAERMRYLLNEETFWDAVNQAAGAIVMEKVDPLSRRNDDARATLQDYGPSSPPPGIWLGVSAGIGESYLERVPALRQVPAVVRFVSAEPLLEDLGAVDLTDIHWLISGGESGHRARPSHPDWHRNLRDRCAAAGVRFLFKQWGEWEYVQSVEDSRSLRPSKLRYFADLDATFYWRGKKAAGRLLDGVEHNGFPS